MYGIGFYDEYLKRMGNLKDKSDMATPYKIIRFISIFRFKRMQILRYKL